MEAPCRKGCGFKVIAQDLKAHELSCSFMSEEMMDIDSENKMQPVPTMVTKNFKAILELGG